MFFRSKSASIAQMNAGMALPRIEDPDEFAKLIVQQYHLEHGNNDGGALM